MNEVLVAFIIVGLILGPLLWRAILAARRRKEAEDDFIEQYINDYAILTFYGSTLEIGGWIFYGRETQWERSESPIEGITKIDSYLGTFTLAIPPGEYDTISSFSYNYGNGSQLGGTGYTKKTSKSLFLEKGCQYRYRLKYFSAIVKKPKYRILFEETVVSPNPMGSRQNMEHTLVLEQLIKENK